MGHTITHWLMESGKKESVQQEEQTTLVISIIIIIIISVTPGRPFIDWIGLDLYLWGWVTLITTGRYGFFKSIGLLFVVGARASWWRLVVSGTEMTTTATVAVHYYYRFPCSSSRSGERVWAVSKVLLSDFRSNTRDKKEYGWTLSSFH